MKIALVEVSHWHVPLYLDGFRRPDLEVVGVTDQEGHRGSQIASMFGCPVFATPETLLDAVEVDLAFVFGRHSEMPRRANLFLDRRIPFSIEKPCGRTLDDVRRLRTRAEAEGAFVAVPLWSRISDLLVSTRSLATASGIDQWDQVTFRFIAGPPSRYEAAGAPWMLDPAVAGGGCMINLAAHLVDLALILLNDEVVSVYGRASDRCFHAPVEDYFLLSFQTRGGGLAVIETGYIFPMTDTEQREFSFSLSSAGHYVRSIPCGIRVYDRSRKKSADVDIRLDADVYYPLFIDRVVEDVRHGNLPVAGLREAEAIMRIVEAGYRSAKKRQVFSLE